MKHICLFLAFSVALLCGAQTDVRPYRAGLTPEGITYFLPKTGFYITMTAIRTVRTPGEYARYAERYLRLRNVALQKEETWTLTDIEVTPIGVADSSRVFSIQLNRKTSAPLVGLAPDGRLLSINASPEALPEAPLTYLQEKITPKDTADFGSDYKTREMLMAGSTAKMAELAAAEIYDLRENRALLAKGQADFMPTDGEQLRLMFASLDHQEKTLLSLFTGKEEQERVTMVVRYVPNGEVENEVFHRFSRHFGFVAADDPVGEPLYITVNNLRTLPAAVEVAPETKKQAEKRERSLRYILPEQGQVRINTLEQEWANLTLPMAQFGRIEYLGGELFNKQNTTHVYLSPTNGGITHITSEVVK